MRILHKANYSIAHVIIKHFLYRKYQQLNLYSLIIPDLCNSKLAQIDRQLKSGDYACSAGFYDMLIWSL